MFNFEDRSSTARIRNPIMRHIDDSRVPSYAAQERYQRDINVVTRQRQTEYQRVREQKIDVLLEKARRWNSGLIANQIEKIIKFITTARPGDEVHVSIDCDRNIKDGGYMTSCGKIKIVKVYSTGIVKFSQDGATIDSLFIDLGDEKGIVSYVFRCHWLYQTKDERLNTRYGFLAQRYDIASRTFLNDGNETELFYRTCMINLACQLDGTNIGIVTLVKPQISRMTQDLSRGILPVEQFVTEDLSEDDLERDVSSGTESDDSNIITDEESGFVNVV